MQFWDNLGCFWTPWEPHPAKKNYLAVKFKLQPIVKVCTVLRDVLAKVSILGKSWVAVILKKLKLNVTLF